MRYLFHYGRADGEHYGNHVQEVSGPVRPGDEDVQCGFLRSSDARTNDEQDCYYFFDEAQYAQDWDKWLKPICDMQPDTRVVATGSARPALVRGNQESGAGRWSVIQVPTMSFYESCALLNLDRPELPKDLKVTPLLRMTQQERTKIMIQLSKVQNHFNRYLQVGGFPEPALSDNDLMAQQIMRENVVDKVLKRDLPSLYSVRNTTELERIFLYLCNVSSEIVFIEAIAKELSGVSQPTVENYIQICWVTRRRTATRVLSRSQRKGFKIDVLSLVDLFPHRLVRQGGTYDAVWYWSFQQVTS